ncbi:hypothetical protein BDN72DRAFT_191454 [Pluteus cervinus]|uniref:Uncharacterized protein n=1 Tax=Pluteus cervinus TaxID=181527 RepID=A0ACD3AIU5_9AGAR|nr:hypothetical protein BDN72DRAFT_191454 [Pluteus cervinus]
MPQLFSPAPATPSPKRASPMRVLATKVKTEVVEVSHRIRKLSLHVPKRRRRESQASSSSFSSSMTSSSTSSNSSAMAAAIISSSTIISTPIFPFVEIITTPTQTAPQTPKAVRGLSEKVVFPAHEDHEVKEVDFAYLRRKRASQESALSSSPSFASARSVTQSGTPLEAEVAPAVDVVEPIREEVPTEILTEDVPVREDDSSLVPPPPPMTTPNSPPAESPAASQTLEQPSVYVEPPVPDPFLIDDGSSSGSEKEQPREVVVSDSQITAALDLPQEISLTQSLPTSPVPLPPADISKPVPPPPPSSGSDPEESEAPELYLPGLVIPTMFLPIPNVRRPFSNYLTWWLSRRLSYNVYIRQIR